MVGLGGSGRATLTRMACVLGGFSLLQVQVASGYGQKEWALDLQAILSQAGTGHSETVFLFKDTQIFKEEILEQISGLL